MKIVSRRFVRSESGATAIEFAFVVWPLIAGIFMTIYTGLMGWAISVLETNLGQVQYSIYEFRPLCPSAANGAFPYDNACIRDRVCEQAPMILISVNECKATAHLDLRRLDENGGVAIPALIENGSINTSVAQTSPGLEKNEIVLMRMAVPFPNWTLGTPLSMASNSGETRLLTAAIAFRIRDPRSFVRPN